MSPTFPRLALAGCLVVLLTVSRIAGFPTAPPVAHAEGQVTVTPNRVLPGQSITVVGSGWAAHDQILVSFSDPSGAVLPLGIIAADASGAFQKVISIPTTVQPGNYQIDGNGQGGSVSVQLTILGPPTVVIPPTPTPLPPTATPRQAEATRQPVRTPTVTSTATATQTPSPTSSPTPTPTLTATPTPSATPTPTSTPTQTPTLPERIINADGGTSVTAFLALLPFLGAAGYFVWRRRHL